MTLALQANAAEDLGSAIVSPSFDEGDGFVCPQNMPPLMSITLQSTQILEMTVSGVACWKFGLPTELCCRLRNHFWES